MSMYHLSVLNLFLDENVTFVFLFMLPVPMMVPESTSETLKHKINPSLELAEPQSVHVLLYTPGQPPPLVHLKLDAYTNITKTFPEGFSSKDGHSLFLSILLFLSPSASLAPCRPAELQQHGGRWEPQAVGGSERGPRGGVRRSQLVHAAGLHPGRELPAGENPMLLM